MFKFCSRCSRHKNLNQFSINNKAKDGKAGLCIDCHKELGRIHYKRYTTIYQDRDRRRRVKIRSWVDDLKDSLCCSSCYATGRSILDFHHLDISEKDASVASIFKAGSLERVSVLCCVLTVIGRFTLGS